MNVYSENIIGYPHVTKMDADNETMKNRIVCKEIEITYTPGEGLS